MSERICGIPDCGRPIPTGSNSPACPRCWAQHRQRLAELPWLIDETTITLTRQNATSGHNITRRAEPPLPYQQAASDALTAITGALRAWAVLARDEHWHQKRLGNRNATELARLLLALDDAGWPHNHDAATDYLTEIHNHDQALRRGIDIPADPEIIGPCPNCDQPLETRYPNAPNFTCPTCGAHATRDTIADRAWELTHDKLMPLDEATAALRYGGYQPPSTREITRWHRRGQLQPTAHDPDGQPLYRLADLQRLVTTTQHMGHP